MMVASLKDYKIPYGVCELEKGKALKAHHGKSRNTAFLVNTGMYVVRRDRLGLIPENERCDMTDFMQRIKENGGRIGVFPIAESA